MRVLMATAFLVLSGCATGPSLDRAIAVTNTSKHIVQAADEAYAPVYDAAFKAASEAHPDDDNAMRAQLKAFDAVVDALTAAKLVTQSLHLAVDQWQQGFDDGTMTREAAACSSLALEGLAAHAAEIPGVGSFVYGATQTLALQLQQLADGKQCEVRR